MMWQLTDLEVTDFLAEGETRGASLHNFGVPSLNQSWRTSSAIWMGHLD